VKAKLYLETTIVSYLVARPSRDVALAVDQKITREWWNKRLHDFDIYVSEVVLAEASAGDVGIAKKRLDVLARFPVLRATPQSQILVRELIDCGILPRKAKADADAAHVALAAVHNIHFLLTWNCRHLANGEILRQVEQFFKTKGCNHPTVCTPRELMGAFEL
jgi:hypothetical protein